MQIEIDHTKTNENAGKAPAQTPPPSNGEDKYEVRINSYKIVGAMGQTIVHNEVAFYRNGEPVVAFNGYAHDPKTGDYNTFAIDPGNTLRVTATEKLHSSREGAQLMGSVSLGGNMNFAEFTEKMKAVAAASKFINDNKLEYVVLGGPTQEAQNSNSVASSLLAAMGYKYPEKEFAHLIAPGSKRPLLPDDWSADNIDGEKLAEMIDVLHAQNVIAQIKREDRKPNTNNQFDYDLINIGSATNYYPEFFDPNKTEVAYNQKDKPVQTTSVASNGFNSASDTLIKTSCDLSTQFSCAVNNTSLQKVPEKAPDVGHAANQDFYNTYAFGGPS